MKPTIFSGVQPTSVPTIGNYIGAMRQFVTLQDDYDATYCVVNQHAITVPQKPEDLHRRTRELAALYLALGIDPKKATIFVQSDVPAHAQAAWIILCLTGLGELERMTQYRDKSKKNENVSPGLLCYPDLMVADIVLYDAQFVPVGDDQKQHLELTRNFVDRFNQKFGNGESLLVKPEPIIPKAGGRVMSLQDPFSKMSKSDPNPKATISLLDEPAAILKKMKSAVTDSIGEVNYNRETQPAIANLLEIFAAFSGQSIEQLVKEYHSAGYGKFKVALAECIIDHLAPIQAEYQRLLTSNSLDDILADGARKANEKAKATLARMERAIGLTYR